RPSHFAWLRRYHCTWVPVLMRAGNHYRRCCDGRAKPEGSAGRRGKKNPSAVRARQGRGYPRGIQRGCWEDFLWCKGSAVTISERLRHHGSVSTIAAGRSISRYIRGARCQGASGSVISASSAVQQTAMLFDHLIGEREQRCR